MDALAELEELRLSEQKKRRRFLRHEENRLAWLAHYEHMSRAHLKISEGYAQKRADLLRMGSTKDKTGQFFELYRRGLSRDAMAATLGFSRSRDDQLIRVMEDHDRREEKTATEGGGG